MNITYDLAKAAAADAANRRMLQGGRSAWDADDYALAVATLDRLNPDDRQLAQEYALYLANWPYGDPRD